MSGVEEMLQLIWTDGSQPASAGLQQTPPAAGR